VLNFANLLCIVPFWDGTEPKSFGFEKKVLGLKEFWG